MYKILPVSLARREVIQEYEGVCSELGAHAGLVDLATFNVVNAVLATPPSPTGDWLLVNVAADYASIAILRGEHLIFFRNRVTTWLREEYSHGFALPLPRSCRIVEATMKPRCSTVRRRW